MHPPSIIVATHHLSMISINYNSDAKPFALNTTFLKGSWLNKTASVLFSVNAATGSTPPPPPPPPGETFHLLEVSGSDSNFLLINDLSSNRSSFGDSYHQVRHGKEPLDAGSREVTQVAKEGSGYTTSMKAPSPFTWVVPVAPFDVNNPPWDSGFPDLTNPRLTVNIGFRYRESFYDIYLMNLAYPGYSNPRLNAILFVENSITLLVDDILLDKTKFRTWVYLISPTSITCHISNSVNNPDYSFYDERYLRITVTPAKVSPLQVDPGSYLSRYDDFVADSLSLIIVKVPS